MGQLRVEGGLVLLDVELLDGGAGAQRPVLTVCLQRVGTRITPGIVAYNARSYALTIPLLERLFERVQDFSEKHANRIAALVTVQEANPNAVPEQTGRSDQE
jgi:phosphate uptake regulator